MITREKKIKTFQLRITDQEYNDLKDKAYELGYDSISRMVRDTLKLNLGIGKRKVKADQMKLFKNKKKDKVLDQVI